MDKDTKDFGFPFQPYSIQVNFMRNLYECLEGSNLGIFESPTGTGKSLSIICSALSWIKDHQSKRKSDLRLKIKAIEAQNDAQADTDDWFEAAVKKSKANDVKAGLKAELKFLEDKDSRLADLKARKKSITRCEVSNLDPEFDQLLRDIQALKGELKGQDDDNLLSDYDSDDDRQNFDREDEETEDFSHRIFYCSRTHSQLSQFIKEIQKTGFVRDIRLVSMASRANMCINPAVKQLGNPTLINEKCLEIQKKQISGKSTLKSGAKRQKTTSGCPFSKQSAITTLKA